MVTPERFMTSRPISEALAEDEAALDAVIEHARTEGWSETVEACGGFSLEGGPVTVELRDNPGYGKPYRGQDGIADGEEPVIDRYKYLLVCQGFAVRTSVSPESMEVIP